ncbi:hypothetical protein nbrc107696_23420 [Gordonia spumicola]|uniref:Uncharacterized protein n=1 Tax=Gordonia spumicola TaxID=589161 RepID=A0A7I9V919_9ACTN|nr:DUF4139 domain-containing protein [Gordonia spumicola]GEE01896.1 hypothetical protein nbrc107696_23420 [Gordonia spumicola]
MTTRPEVTRLVLFKHGIAYLERRGATEGSFDLTFRASEMNDVLKSLAVGIVDGAVTVESLDYAAPSDPDDDLERRNLSLPTGDALIGLLRVARGRTVEAFTGAGSTSGEVIGVQEDNDRRQLVLWTSGRVELVDLAGVTGVRFADDQTGDDISYLVDRSRAATAGDTRTVTVALSGPSHDVAVSYIVQAPVWRVSYRLICDGDAIDLVAVGIVHNPIDEDLDGIDLTLTTGRPSSFEIDLYRDRRVARATVDDVDYETGPPPIYQSFGVEAVPAAMSAPTGAAPKTRSLGAVFDGRSAEAAEVGEQFEYRVRGAVSLKRGMASMVPLVTARLTGARRERFWRPGSSPEPDIVAAFDNSTDAVLEAGPVVVYDENSYAGEAMMPFTARGAGVRLAFGKDPAITCRSMPRHSSVTTRVRIGDGALLQEVRSETATTIAIVNKGDADREVIVELPITDQTTAMTADEYISAYEETDVYRRYRIDVPAHSRADVTAGEYRVAERWTSYTDIRHQALADWLARSVLDRATFDALQAVLRHHDKAAELDAVVDDLRSEYDHNIAEQDRLTKQLDVLRNEGSEGRVRESAVARLVALQQRTDEIDAAVAATTADAAAERAAADSALADATTT